MKKIQQVGYDLSYKINKDINNTIMDIKDMLSEILQTCFYKKNTKIFFPLYSNRMYENSFLTLIYPYNDIYISSSTRYREERLDLCNIKFKNNILIIDNNKQYKTYTNITKLITYDKNVIETKRLKKFFKFCNKLSYIYDMLYKNYNVYDYNNNIIGEYVYRNIHYLDYNNKYEMFIGNQTLWNYAHCKERYKIIERKIYMYNTFKEISKIETQVLKKLKALMFIVNKEYKKATIIKKLLD